MRNINWDEVNEAGNYPTPGGYVAQIVGVKDDEAKECIQLRWDFCDGQYAGSNRATFDSHGFWPTLLIRSYKQNALPFFKKFKTAVEESNRNYVFRNAPNSLMGKYIGVVLGEEEYQANNGSIKKRLYVAENVSVNAIEDGKYTVPGLKKLKGTESNSSAFVPAPSYQAPDFGMLDDDDAQLPF